MLVRAMICLNIYEIGEELDVKISAEKKKRIRLYNEMIETAQEGIDRAPDKGECYFMRGLAYARLSTTRGVFSSLLTAKKIEKDWLEAIKHDSDYVTPRGENLQASSYIALGTYYRLCPTFFLLKLLFGISGDLDKAVFYCAKAYDMDPTRIEIVKELADQADFNAHHLRGSHAPIEIYCADATEANYRQGTVYLLFNPFGPQTLRWVLKKIEETLEDFPRMVRLAYFNPVNRIVIETCQWLRWAGDRRFPFCAGHRWRWPDARPVDPLRRDRRKVPLRAVCNGLHPSRG